MKQNFSRNTETETVTPKKAEILAEPKFRPKHIFRPNATISPKNGNFGKLFQNIFHQTESKNIDFWQKWSILAAKVFWPNCQKWT